MNDAEDIDIYQIRKDNGIPISFTTTYSNDVRFYTSDSTYPSYTYTVSSSSTTGVVMHTLSNGNVIYLDGGL